MILTLIYGTRTVILWTLAFAFVIVVWFDDVFFHIIEWTVHTCEIRRGIQLYLHLKIEKKMKIYFLQRFLTNNPFCRSAYFNKLFMVPIGKTMVFKSFWLCTFLGNPVALFYVFSYHPFWEVFWTMVYDTNGWNRLKTGFFGLKLALRRNIDLFI